MLLYSNGGYFRLCLQLSGSVLYQKSTIGIGFCLALCNVAIQALIVYGPSYLEPKIPNNYGVATLGMVVAFASVFRTNLAWQRYWESLSQVRYMYSKCGDAFSAFAAFSRITVERMSSKGDEDSKAKARRVQDEYERVLNYFGWLSALAVDRITHGCTNRMDRRREVAAWKDQFVTLKELHHTDVTGATKLPELHVGRAADQRTNHTWENSFVVSALPSKRETDILNASDDRVQVVITWILGSLSHVSSDLDMPPPIQSRVYQEISNAMVGFQNCVKIADVPFPFPYAQLLIVLVGVFAMITPLAVACFTRSFLAGPLFTLVVWSAIWCVNEVAKELENPFGVEINDIHLEDLHGSFMSMLEETASVLDCQRAERQEQMEHEEAQIHADGNTPQENAYNALVGFSKAAEQPVHGTALLDARGPNTFKDLRPATGNTGVFLAPELGKTMKPPGDVNGPPAQVRNPGREWAFGTSSKARSSKPTPQACVDGADAAISDGGGPLQAVHVIDSKLAQISIRMESQLAQIAKELKALSALPAIARGSPRGDYHV